MKRVATLAVWEGQSLLMGVRRDNGLWTTPGGHLEGKETPVEGALRELEEETGIRASAAELRPVGRKDKPGLELHMFQLSLNGRKPTALQDPDGEFAYLTFLDCTYGFPVPPEKLHVPKNDLLKALGLQSWKEEAKMKRLSTTEKDSRSLKDVQADLQTAGTEIKDPAEKEKPEPSYAEPSKLTTAELKKSPEAFLE